MKKSPCKLLALLAGAFISIAAAHAQNCTWTNSLGDRAWTSDPSSTNWDDGLSDLNWQPGGDAFFETTGTGTVNISGDVNVNSVTFDAAGYTIAGATGATLTLTGAAGITANANATISSVIAGTAGLKTFGTGTLTLTGANTYTGSTTINSGTLVIQNSNQSNAYNIAVGATLGFNVATGTLDLPMATFSGTGSLLKTGAGTLQWGVGSATFAMSAGSVIDVQGGAFTGGSSANENWTGNLSSLNIASGSNFYGSEANVRIDALTGSGDFWGGAAAYTGYLNDTIGVAGGSGTFSGRLADYFTPLSLVKIGTGTQRLTGASVYTGTTTVSAGTLSAENNKALGNTSSVIVNGGTLDIRGITAGTVTIGGAGKFTLTSGTIKLQLGTTFDQLVSSGAGTFTLTGGTLALDVTGTGFSYGNSYQVFSGFGGVNTVSGLTITGYDTANWSASLSTLGVLRFTAVPEPSTWAMLLGGIGMLAMFRRRA
jgi:autotransporter-associated beta strand protein